MNTFILKWNPAISSYGMDRFDDDFHFGWKKKIIEDPFTWEFNWSVWDHDKAHKGDRFFMVRVGDGENNGIVMSGTFCSEPYQSEDWSGRGRTTFYMDMILDIVIDPKSDKVLPSSRLEKYLPSIEWTKGHSGLIIEPEDALSLEKIWYNHLKADLSKFAKAAEIARIAHFGQKDKAGEDYIFHPTRVSKNLYGNECVVALLHDVVEDSEFTLDDLTREGFSKEVTGAVKALSRRDEEPYETFIRRVGRNKLARAVKLFDLKDNMDLLRLPKLTEEDLERIVKYHKAYKYLSKL